MKSLSHVLASCLIMGWLVSMPSNTAAQTDSAQSPIKLSGYIESYYGYDLGKPTDHNRPAFVYSYNRHNEVNLNLGFVKAAYETNTLRGNLAFMAGTYANANLATEPGVLKNICEANVGVKLSRTANLWVDAGIFTSHIGFESAIGKDCWTLSRSILADNSPYYESGAKISYTSNNQQWFVSGLVLNGWQRIQRQVGNNMPAFGHQITYKPSTKITLNSSSFVGSNTPDSIRQMRYFHNLYGQFELSPKWGLQLGFDIGAEQKYKNSNGYNIWYAPIALVRYSASDRLRLAARGEYYSDVNAVIIATPQGFQTYGYSLNLDFSIAHNAVWRIEGRGFKDKHPIFTNNGLASHHYYFITTALAISF